MARKFLLFSVLVTLFAGQLSAAPFWHRHNKKQLDNGINERTMIADPGEAYYDMKYVQFHLNMSDTSLFISGNVATTAMSIVFSMTSYVFELDTTFTIDSAKVNGVLLPVFNTGATVRTIILPTALDSGAMFTAQIYYHGFPPPGSGFFNGLTHAVSAGGTNMVYSISDPYQTPYWWPSKQCLTDKIDSVDMFITVPSGVYDGSNGLLVNIDSVSNPGYWQFHWQTHYAIEYYLVSVAVARYAMFNSYLHFTGSTDSMLIQDFFLDTATFDPLYKANFDSIGMIINYFSSLFGRYPFWHEKYGVCFTSLPGGMEHQTMTTIGVANTYIIAHELCHQWFGDHVSFGDWHDVWLSEGFATYAQSLFYDEFNGHAAATANRKIYMNSATSVTCGCTYVSDTTSPSTLFYQPTVYNKGQAIINMLRYIAPSDSVFFAGLQLYQQEYGFSEATTAKFQAVMEGVYGFSLDTFINQWIYGSGFPYYSLAWNQVGSTVYLQLIQSASCSGTTPLFISDVEVELLSASGIDTIVKLYNNADTQLYVFNWTQTMDTFAFNPDVWTLGKFRIASHYHNPTLGVANQNTSSLSISPNPTKNNWIISGLIPGTQLSLIDVNGNVLWNGTAVNGDNTVPGEGLSPGDYFIRLNNETDKTVKLVHW